MRINITVMFDVVEEIYAGEHSVDLADMSAIGMGPREAADFLADAIEREAQKSRALRVAAKDRPASAATGNDYPLDPDQD